jgi:hypothetical protein
MLLCILALPGCDKLKFWGAAAPDTKESDAQAIGYACRVSRKLPEECMKENDSHNPTQILHGWKSADKDIKEHVIDINMSGDAAASSVRPTPPTDGKKLPGR